MAKHVFTPEYAERFGVAEAVVLENIIYWIEKNAANDKHFYDGHYWTYNSVKAFEKMFPYLSKKQLRRILEKLEEEGVLISGNYNASSYDRTKWYAVNYSALPNCPNGQMGLPEWANGLDQKGKPIPYINTDINKNNNTSDGGEDIKGIYDHYMAQDNLIGHRKYTKTMYRAIKQAMKDLSLTVDECKTIITRHSKVVEVTKDTDYPVTVRGLDVLFGQKAYKAKHLLCAEYLDDGDKYLRYLAEPDVEEKVEVETLDDFAKRFGIDV